MNETDTGFFIDPNNGKTISKEEAMKKYPKIYCEALELATTSRFLSLDTEQQLRLSCAEICSRCAKEIGVESVETLAFKASMLAQFVLTGKKPERP